MNIKSYIQLILNIIKLGCRHYNELTNIERHSIRSYELPKRGN